ncbi:HAMP domain-containing histidine kinase [Candidatus Curtissbacteria bacterium]|nr:HAMP domain-containing histidine kinase [Candidatus Curtissbacteria bacterium]
MFHSARIKLTAWYLLIIMLVSITFSTIIYQGIVREVERFDRAQRVRIQRRLLEQTGDLQSPLPMPSSNPELVKEAEQRVLALLFFINAIILLVSGGLGYLLAGYTLNPIKKMVEDQNRFIADASHELRTPLTSLKSSIEVFMRGKTANPKEVKELLSSNLEEVNQLESLTADLLQLTKYEAGNGKVHFDRVEIETVIDKAVQRVQPLAVKKHIKIIKKTIKKQVIGEAESLTKLITALLDNAIKYSSKNSTISVFCKQIDSIIEITVQDSGIGIDQKELGDIFNRFYRSDKSRSKENIAGYGLGLAIAKKIVDNHKGTITVKSKVGHGTAFTIHLPISHTRV